MKRVLIFHVICHNIAEIWRENLSWGEFEFYLTQTTFNEMPDREKICTFDDKVCGNQKKRKFERDGRRKWFD
jgi:hypothetical protein